MLAVQVLTAVLALSRYCDCFTYENDLHHDTSSFSPRNITTLNSGLSPVLSGLEDGNSKSKFDETSISDTETVMSTITSSSTSEITLISTNEIASTSETSHIPDRRSASVKTVENAEETTVSTIETSVTNTGLSSDPSSPMIAIREMASSSNVTSKDGRFSKEPTNSSPSTEDTTVLPNIETSTRTVVISSGTSQVTLISTNEVTTTSDPSPTADRPSAAVTASESAEETSTSDTSPATDRTNAIVTASESAEEAIGSAIESSMATDTSSITSQVTSISTNEITSTSDTSPTIDWTNATITTFDFCGCDNMQLVLGTLLVGNNWFAVQLNSTSSKPECPIENLTGLNVIVNGPFDKDDEFLAELQNCLPSVDCLDGSNNSFLFNSSLCCENITILQCSNYNFSMTPQYSACAGHPDPADGLMFTLPGPEAAPQNVTVLDTGSDWILISWQDFQFCLKTLTSYFMRFEPLRPSGGNNTINIKVPLTCANRSFVTGVTVFSSKTCPELFNLDPCTDYSVTVEVEVYGKYLSEPSQSVMFNTKPPKDLVTQIGQMESGPDWLTFQWNLSVPQCQMATSGFRLNLTNSRNNSYETYNCNIATLRADSKFLFNTSSNDCGESVNVTACSDYEIIVIPKIFDLLYDGSPGKALGRTTCETIKAFIASIDSGSYWISFNWTTSVQDCRKVLTGFWISIASTEQSEKRDSFQFISMKDCYCNLKEDQAIMFNTSTTCNSWINPGIFPCSEYGIIIIPQFFNSLNGSAGPLNKTSTLPDEKMTPVTQNIEAGKHWISFEWQASLNTCRDAVTGLWISMKPSPPNSSNERFCSIESDSDKFIAFNTSSVCFNETLSPCTPYTFEIKLDINGKIGQFNIVIETTTPGDDATALINNHKYGLNWISFWWQSSVPECQRFVTGYQLNVTDLFNDTSQFRSLSRNCSKRGLEEREWFFNSSLPCTELEISPCSNYSISLSPLFRIGNQTVINGIIANIEIGTQSGEEGEIDHPNVISQGTNSLTLEWFEPKCRNLLYYNVTVMPKWNLGRRNEKSLKITPDCLEKHSSGSVSVILNNTTCQNGYEFVSCAPYNIAVLPVYQLSSANENLVGWANDTQTLPFQDEASVSNLTVQDVGTRWISISWPIPSCRVMVNGWILSESKNKNLTLPPDCPTKVNGNYLTLNVSDTIVCSSNVSFKFVHFIPCTNYSLGIDVKYSNLEVQNGSDNVISVPTEIEPPGIVRNVTWYSTKNNVSLKWEPPRINPQCVEGYQISWNSQAINTKKTQYLIEGLEPCSMFPVTVNALPDSSLEVPGPFHVSTKSVDPAPITSEINVVKLQNGFTRNVSWVKPEVDYCISGYNITIIRATSTDVVYNSTVREKDTTWITLNEGFEQGKSYNILLSSFCSFEKNISASNYISHTFTWNSASDMVRAVVIVSAVMFPILALVIICAVVLIRKSQGSILAPGKFSDESKSTRCSGIHNKALNSRRPVMIRELKCTIEWLDANSNYELSKEYEMLKSLTDKSAICTVAELPENRAKNRYSDILPYDHSRVKLTTVPPSSDYINASFISGYAGNRAYIAAQGPKPSTIEHFWLMCFEQNVKVIVALTMLEEKGRVKCAQYWPSTSSSCEFGNFSVQLTKEVIGKDYTTRDFLVTKISSKGSIAPKFVRQMHFTEWPDFGCPQNPEQLVNFIHAVRNQSIYLNDKYRVNCPIVVHCSAGVGRTGTLIALDILMEQARCKKIVDIMRTVLKLRKDRDRMVQTEEQYHFLYKCIYAYARNELQLSKFVNSSASNSTIYQASDDIPLTPLSFFQKDPFANNYSRKSSFATM